MKISYDEMQKQWTEKQPIISNQHTLVILAILVFVVTIIIYSNEIFEDNQQISVGDNEVAVMIDPDLTDCESRGIVSEVASGCVLSRLLTDGHYSIPASYRVEIVSLDIQKFEWKINIGSATIKEVSGPTLITNTPVDE